MTIRPMPILTIVSLISVIILIVLGNWQMERYVGKKELPDRIPEADFVTFSGKRLTAPIQFAYTTHAGEPLWRVFAEAEGCLTRANGEAGCEMIAYVNLALLNAVRPDEANYKPNIKSWDDAEFVVVPNQKRQMFAPKDSPERAEWYVADASAFSKALGRDLPSVLLEPELIEIVQRAPDGNLYGASIENPIANPARLDNLPPARHLGYAWTWYGLALGLIVMYIALHVSRGRFRFGKSS